MGTSSSDANPSDWGHHRMIIVMFLACLGHNHGNKSNSPVPACVSTPIMRYLSDLFRPNTPLSGDLRVDVNKIRNIFRNRVEAFRVPGQLRARPTTITCYYIWNARSTKSLVPWRGRITGSKVEHAVLGPPDPSSSVGIPVPESGCGKTRSMIEVLCLHWGYYFNAGKNMTLLLFLSRLMILSYCLKVPSCCQMFSSARWTLLQVCPDMFKDVFLELLRKIYDQMTERNVLGSVLSFIVRNEFGSVREILAAHDYSTFQVSPSFS
ncbi:MAG: hypothetical protein J3R72DRAFT_496327 [Linnemannia gamsii]|nr:MAG: hypothetical protein J3R72DRAFT_496327 [Linnemannia gamsii]